VDADAPGHSRAMSEPVPFTVDVPHDVLVDLIGRLTATRWPPRAARRGWPGGVDQECLQALVARWRDGLDRPARQQVNPSCPGRLLRPGRHTPRASSSTWHKLMADVAGYLPFCAHGGDIGAMVTNRLAVA